MNPQICKAYSNILKLGKQKTLLKVSAAKLRQKHSLSLTRDRQVDFGSRWHLASTISKLKYVYGLLAV